MAIALGTAVSGKATGAASITLASVVVSGSDRSLFVGAGSSSGGGAVTVSSVSWNGSTTGWVTDWSRTFSVNFNVTGRHLVAPAATTASVVVTWASAPDELEAGAVPMTGVDQTTAVGTAASADGVSATASVDVSSAVNELVLDHVYAGVTTGTVGAGQTQVFRQTSIGSFSYGGTSQEGGAGTVTMSWTHTSTEWGIGAIPFKPAGGAAAASRQSLLMMGMGR